MPREVPVRGVEEARFFVDRKWIDARARIARVSEKAPDLRRRSSTTPAMGTSTPTGW
jgi:hypothetical protein